LNIILNTLDHYNSINKAIMMLLQPLNPRFSTLKRVGRPPIPTPLLTPTPAARPSSRYLATPNYALPPIVLDPFGNLLTSVGLPLLLGQLIGLWSIPEVAFWYPELKKPKWTIPAPLFGPIWGILYAMMGIAAHKVSTASGGIVPLSWYVAQLGLNLLWQALFFKSKMLRMASREIVVLLGVLGVCVWQFFKVDVMAGRMMVPYLGFTVYAAALSWAIASKNE
jgi:translocator protein